MGIFKKKDQVEKPKEFTLNDVELSELSFITQNQKVKQEEFAYWGGRFNQVLTRIKGRLGVVDGWELDTKDLWTLGKVYAFKKPEPQPNPKMKVESKGDAKPELQKKQE